jgi:hypothetical protein
LVERVGERALLLPREAAGGEMGIEDRHSDLAFRVAGLAGIGIMKIGAYAPCI